MPENAAEMIAKLLADPAAVKMLSSLTKDVGKSAAPPEPSDEPTQTLPVPAVPPSLAESGDGFTRHAALLSAIRPFLPEANRQRIDGMIRMLRIAQTVRQWRRGQDQ